MCVVQAMITEPLIQQLLTFLARPTKVFLRPCWMMRPRDVAARDHGCIYREKLDPNLKKRLTENVKFVDRL